MRASVGLAKAVRGRQGSGDHEHVQRLRMQTLHVCLTWLALLRATVFVDHACSRSPQGALHANL